MWCCFCSLKLMDYFFLHWPWCIHSSIIYSHNAIQHKCQFVVHRMFQTCAYLLAKNDQKSETLQMSACLYWLHPFKLALHFRYIFQELSSKGNIISDIISTLIFLHVIITSCFGSNLLKVLPADLFSLCRHQLVPFKAYLVFLQESPLFLCISLILPCLDGFLQIFKVFCRTLLFLPTSCFGHQCAESKTNVFIRILYLTHTFVNDKDLNISQKFIQ